MINFTNLPTHTKATRFYIVSSDMQRPTVLFKVVGQAFILTWYNTAVEVSSCLHFSLESDEFEGKQMLKSCSE